jgi:hypothetical protein
LCLHTNYKANHMNINYCQLASLVVKRKLIHSKTIHQNDVHSTNSQWSLHCYKLVQVDRINYASCSTIPTIGFKFTYLGFKKLNGVTITRWVKSYTCTLDAKTAFSSHMTQKNRTLIDELLSEQDDTISICWEKTERMWPIGDFEWTLIACMLNLFARECDFSHTISCSSWHVWGNFVVSSIIMYNI